MRLTFSQDEPEIQLELIVPNSHLFYYYDTLLHYLLTHWLGMSSTLRSHWGSLYMEKGRMLVYFIRTNSTAPVMR